VGRRRSAQRSARGGGGIQALRQARSRLALAAAVAYAGVLAYAVLRSPSLAGVVSVVGGLGATLLVLVLVRGSTELLRWALFLLAAAYTISLLARGHSVDEGTPLAATGLLLCGELAAWSVDERYAITGEPHIRARGTRPRVGSRRDGSLRARRRDRVAARAPRLAIVAPSAQLD
jgi:hypothetical protein